MLIWTEYLLINLIFHSIHSLSVIIHKALYLWNKGGIIRMNTAFYLVLSLPLSLFPVVVKHANSSGTKWKAVCFFQVTVITCRSSGFFKNVFLEHHNNNSIITVITLSGCITVTQSGTLENESLFEYGPKKCFSYATETQKHCAWLIIDV